MLNYSGAQLDRTFTALADPTRRAILRRLAGGEATAGELARPFPISAPAISRHLRVLERAGLITRRRDRQHQRCRLQPRALQSASRWLDLYRDFWSQSLDQLDQYLKTSNPKRRSHARGNPRRR